MSEQLTLKLNNISQCTRQLPAQITRHEIEGERKTEFVTLVTLCMVSVRGVPLTFFSIMDHVNVTSLCEIYRLSISIVPSKNKPVLFV